MASEEPVALTSELYVAAYLLLKDEIRFAGFKRNTPKSLYFTFAPKAEADQFITEFLSGRAMVNAREYANAFRAAKELLNTQKPY